MDEVRIPFGQGVGRGIDVSASKSKKKTVTEYTAGEVVKELAARDGMYEGEGTNHEGDRFRGALRVDALVGGTGARLTYVAKGSSGPYTGVVLHAEEALVSRSDVHRLVLCNVHSNAKTLIVHPAVHTVEEEHTWRAVFDSGPPAVPRGLRERIHLTLWNDGDIGYDYEWAVGDMDMGVRSRVRMHRTQ